MSAPTSGRPPAGPDPRIRESALKLAGQIEGVAIVLLVLGLLGSLVLLIAAVSAEGAGTYGAGVAIAAGLWTFTVFLLMRAAAMALELLTAMLDRL